MNCVFIKNLKFFVHFTRKTTKLEVKTPNCFSRKLMYFLICLLLMIMVTSFFIYIIIEYSRNIRKGGKKQRFFIQIVVWLKFFLKSMHSFFKKTKSFFLDSIQGSWGGKEAGGHFFFVSWLAKFSGSMGLNEDLYRCSK